ncbi:glycosyltransferase family 2 protein [Lysobacter niastensis]|uniref:Glycosyltransferase family 2 protein n=1 Tax=Lysobacter niastensis TaxID=380629 RepID=A0ABS0B9Z0_9GAMM|nr:glycosyltransferase family 2 protein [Lysobacter niastensis]MBF6025826.1 glycosyltransferase family 2 protein [Lysobacter niastensis]
MLGRFRGIGLELHAQNQLRIDDAARGAGRYESLGEDPQFDVRVAGGVGRLAAGWYLLTGHCQVKDGEIIAPCFYPDYGEGQSEATRIDLAEPDSEGRLRSLVLIKRRLRMLRLDPTIHRATFEISGLRLRRISRPQAMLEMLRGIGRSPCRSADAKPALAAFLRQAFRGRLSAGADMLHRRYLEAQRETDRGYQQWTALFGARAGMRRTFERAQALSRHPVISIVVPVHNTPPALLHSCIDSVLSQSYPHWQLCIVDDVSSHAPVRELLAQYAQKDARIQVRYRTEHGHICASSNDAIAMAEGEYVGFLDHDDELSPDALYEVAKALHEHPDAHLIYSDEDKIDEAGRRFDPHFKPAWNPDLLRALNYVCHFTVIRADLVRRVRGLRAGFEGAQDHDLVLRCTEHLQREQIVHIPKVLYHWRAIPGSTAMGVSNKPYALEAGRRAVEEHYTRIGRPCRVEITADGHYRGQWLASADTPKVSIIIPTRDKVELLRTCIDSIFEKTTYPDYDLVVVDNGSIEADAKAYLEQLRGHERVTVLDYAAPFNYSAIINHAVARTTADIVCLLNNDIEVITPQWLDHLAAHAARPEVGVVGAMLYYPNDTIQHAGVVLGIGGVAGHVHARMERGTGGYIGRAGVTHNLTAVTGACMVMRRSVFDEVEGMDESLPVAFNDVDLCIRIHKRGYDNVWTPQSELYHHESASRGIEDTPEKQARFALEADRMKRKWGEYLRHDPAYNPNLSLDSCSFDLAFPPRNLSSRHTGLSTQAQ